MVAIGVSIFVCVFVLFVLIVIAHVRGGKCEECDGGEADLYSPCGTCGGTGIYPKNGRVPRGAYNPHSHNPSLVSYAPATTVKTRWRKGYLGAWPDRDMNGKRDEVAYHRSKEGL